MKDLTVFVLTHNRGTLLLDTLDSVLNQTCNDFKVIVSDNSTNDETKNLLKKFNYIEKIEYRKRDKDYSSLAHFNLCISEVDTTYFILFHDDDIMMPDYIENMYHEITKGYAAVGCNAYILNDNKATKKKFFPYKKDKIIFYEELPIQYIKCQIAPLPTYIYNKSLLQELLFTKECGKYNDVLWLLSIAKKNNLFWISKPLIYYRIHKGQDSHNYDYENQEKLIKKYEEILGAENYYIKKSYLELQYQKCLMIYRSSKKIHNEDLKILFKKSKYLFIKLLLKIIIRRV